MIEISAVSGDVASLEYVKNVISSCKDEQVSSPRDEELRRDIVKMFHNHETAGHPGELETYNLVKEHYWWPGLRTFVKRYVKGCVVCQQFKIDHHPSHPAFIPTEGSHSTRPFAYCSMDMITGFPLGHGRPRPYKGGDSSTLC